MPPRARSRVSLRPLALLALVPVLSACATLGPGSAAGGVGPSAERPTYQIGDKWMRSDGAFELRRIENDQYVFEAGGREVRLTRDLGLAKNQDGRFYVELDPPFNLSWPLRVGKFGSTSGRWRWHAIPVGGAAEFTWSVDAYEDLTVPAGTFKAFRILLKVDVGRTWPDNRPAWTRKMTLWYAPEVRQFIKSDAPRDMIPLASFDLLSAPPPGAKPPAATAGTGVRADRPTYTLGDRWIRSDGVFELIRIQDGVYVFSADGGNEVHLTKSLSVAKLVSGESRRTMWEFSPAPELGWPLAVGKRGSSRGNLTPLMWGRTIPGELQWNVDAYEDVEVPAGKFKAFRILFTAYSLEPRSNVAAGRRGYSGPSGPSKWEFRMWYAPEVRQIVKAKSNDLWAHQFDVVAVDPGDTAPLAITLQDPKDQTRVGAFDEVVASGKAAGGKGVARVTVSINGQEVAKEEAKTDSRKVILFRFPLKLRDGKNVVLVTATDPVGTAIQEARTLFYSAPPRLALPPPGGRVRVDKETVLLAGSVSKPGGISWLTVWVNEVEVFQRYGLDVRELSVEAPVKLQPGENIVRLRVLGADGEPSRLESVIVFEKPGLLRLVLPAPGQRTTVASDDILLEGKITSATPMLSATIALNDVDQITRLGNRGREVGFETPLRLNEGENRLVVKIVDETGAIREESRTIVFKRSASAPVVAATPAPKPEPPAVTPPPAPPVKREPPKAEPPKAEPPKAEAPKPEPPKPAPVIAPRPEPAPAIVAPPPQVVVASIPKPVPPASPFIVRLSSPSDHARFEFDSIALAGLVSGGRGVGRVVVTLNGQEVTRVDERRPAVALNLPVRLREGQNTLVVTATDVEGTPYQEVRTVHYEKIVPLSVELRYPEDRAKVTQASTVVVATIASSRGITRVGVTVNGAEVRLPDEVGTRDLAVVQRVKADAPAGGPRKSVTMTVPVTLAEGTNVIVVSAMEPDGTARQAVRTVTYEKPAAVAALPPPAPQVALPNRWAVIIGIGSYDSPSVGKLKYTVNDAEALYEVLTGPGGFKKENVLRLTDKSEKKPTLRNIKWALGTFLARSAKKDDTVFIFFAGHGAPEVDPRGVERDGLAKYLVPADADPDDLYSTALPMDELHAIFGRMEAERVVAFLDACYSGAAGGRTFAAKSTRAGSLDDQFLERLTRSKGRAIITASRPSEVSLELDELRHGVFTYFLVEGLKGAADLNRDGIVTLQELYEYVEQRVAQKSRAAGGNQHPIMKGELEGALPIVKVGGR